MVLPTAFYALSLSVASFYKGTHAPQGKIFRISVLHTLVIGSAMPAHMRLELQKIFSLWGRRVLTDGSGVRARQRRAGVAVPTASGFNTAIAPLTPVKTLRPYKEKIFWSSRHSGSCGKHMQRRNAENFPCEACVPL